MTMTLPQTFGRPLAILAAATALAACSDRAPIAPDGPATLPARFETLAPAAVNDTVATLRRVTAHYHSLDNAIADGFVFLHGCEVRDEGKPVGIVYINPKRLLDGAIDPSLPDGLIYEARVNGSPRLVAVEMAIPFAQWTSSEPPKFLGATFQREDEFGVFGLHVWLWRNNPDGLFAETNPNVFCTPE